MILASKDIQAKALDGVFAEFDKLARDLPLLEPNEPQKGPLIKVPGELARYWEFQHGASKWRSLDFHKLSKVRTVRFVELCKEYGFTDETDIPVKAQMLPSHAWRASDRTELQEMLDIVAA